MEEVSRVQFAEKSPAAMMRPGGVSRRASAVNFIMRHVLKRHVARNGLNARTARTVVRWVELLTVGFSKSAAIRRVILGGISCDVTYPPEPKPVERVVLYLHGGGFFIHLPKSYKRFAKRIAKAYGATVYLPDYRLAPEHRHPNGADDCIAVYRALIAEGCDPRYMTIMGDSAGGNLALVTLLRARDEGLPLPACVTLLSPGTDLTFSGASYIRNAKADPMIPINALHEVAKQYMATDDKEHPYASPMLGDFTGLPPLKIVVGSTEVLLDSSLTTARRYRAAGSKAVVQVWHKMPHVFPLFHFLPEGQMAMQHMADFFNKHTAPTVPAAKNSPKSSHSN